MRLAAPLAVLAGVAVTSAACGSAPPDDPAPPVPRASAGEYAYGDQSEQHATLSLPPDLADDDRLPVVVLIHGGFWREQYRADLMNDLADDVVDHGMAAWNIEYRKVGEKGGGYPGTLDDIAAAIDYLEDLRDLGAPIDLERVAVVGHSAGGHLSLWVATRDDPVVTPWLVVGQAPVADLVDAADIGLGGGAVTDFMGARPGDALSDYAAASPAERLDRFSAEQMVVQGSADTIVPEPYVERYVELVRSSGGDIDYRVFPDDDHFSVIGPDSPAWQAVIERLTSA